MHPKVTTKAHISYKSWVQLRV